MRSLFSTLAAVFGASQIAQEVEAVKILMAGDFDVDHRPFFDSIAKEVSSNTDYENTVYLMSTDLPATEVVKVNDRLFKYGVGTDRVFEISCKESETENYERLDLATAEMYFKNQVMLEDLKKQEF